MSLWHYPNVVEAVCLGRAFDGLTVKDALLPPARSFPKSGTQRKLSATNGR